jgi:hypothetical protein
MTYLIIFDTNYIRGLGTNEYLSGNLPEKFLIQLDRAAYRGDTNIIVETVRMEVNAFIKEIVRKDDEELDKAYKLLTSKGYSITPALEYHSPPDMLETILKNCPKCIHEVPTIEDYKEAEEVRSRGNAR